MLYAAAAHRDLPCVAVEPTVFGEWHAGLPATGRQGEDPEFKFDPARIDPVVQVSAIEFGPRRNRRNRISARRTQHPLPIIGPGVGRLLYRVDLKFRDVKSIKHMQQSSRTGSKPQ